MTVTGSACSLLIYYQLGLSEYQHNLPTPGLVPSGQLSQQSGQGLRGSWAHLLFQRILTAGFKLLIYFFWSVQEVWAKKKKKKRGRSIITLARLHSCSRLRRGGTLVGARKRIWSLEIIATNVCNWNLQPCWNRYYRICTLILTCWQNSARSRSRSSSSRWGRNKSDGGRKEKLLQTRL